MVHIEEILQLPKEEQLAIIHAIQENMDDFEDADILSAEHIAFVEQRIKDAEAGNSKTFNWEEAKEQLKSRWATQ